MNKRLTICTSIIALTILGSFGLIRVRALAQDKLKSTRSLIVHEWGTMTSVMGEDGVAVSWRPLSTHSDLPDFVYGAGSPNKRLPTLPNSNTPYVNFNLKANLSGTVRLETPVVYFYANQDTTASFKVDFPRGKMTEWYPQGDRGGTSLNWKNFLVSPGTGPDLPVDRTNPGSRYYAARATDSAMVRTLGTDGLQNEKFLFYRGVGTFDLPLTINLDGDNVSVRGKQSKAPAQAILFENQNGVARYQLSDIVDGQVVFDRQAPSNTLASLHADLISMLVANGLYPKEAEAMIATWGDQWFEEGLRVFYVMPREITDSLLPITVSPQPTEMKRVLVCRAELITPEMEASVREQIVKLGDESADVRAGALKALREHSRFLEPVLKRIDQSTDDQAIKARIDDLIAKLPAKTYFWTDD